jgi:psiF repeat
MKKWIAAVTIAIPMLFVNIALAEQRRCVAPTRKDMPPAARQAFVDACQMPGYINSCEKQANYKGLKGSAKKDFMSKCVGAARSGSNRRR